MRAIRGTDASNKVKEVRKEKGKRAMTGQVEGGEGDGRRGQAG